MKVLISGGGIAGLSLASWLSRFGARVTLVERGPALRAGGYAIDVRGAAMTVADRMGIGDRVRAGATGMGGASVVDRDGRVLVGVRTADVLSAPGDVEITRGDLARILFDSTRNDAEYLYGDSIQAMEQDAEGVRVSFESGPSQSFDLVIGADGLHSTVRRLTFGAEADFIHHLGYYVSVFTVPDRPDLDRWALLYNRPGSLAGLYNSRGGTHAVLAFASPRLQYDRRDDEAQRAIVADVFSGSGWVTDRLLAEMSGAPDFYFDEVSRVRMPHWSRGRVALVGDAGYCASFLSGQGTSLAMVGAYVLAVELATAHGDHQAAFARYEARLRAFVRANQTLADSGGSLLIPPTRARLWLRNTALRAAARLPRLSGFLANLNAATNAVALPDIPLSHF